MIFILGGVGIYNGVGQQVIPLNEDGFMAALCRRLMEAPSPGRASIAEEACLSGWTPAQILHFFDPNFEGIPLGNRS